MIYQSLNPKCSETQFRWVKLRLTALKLSAKFFQNSVFRKLRATNGTKKVAKKKPVKGIENSLLLTQKQILYTAVTTALKV